MCFTSRKHSKAEGGGRNGGIEVNVMVWDNILVLTYLARQRLVCDSKITGSGVSSNPARNTRCILEQEAYLRCFTNG